MFYMKGLDLDGKTTLPYPNLKLRLQDLWSILSC